MKCATLIGFSFYGNSHITHTLIARIKIPFLSAGVQSYHLTVFAISELLEETATTHSLKTFLA